MTLPLTGAGSSAGGFDPLSLSPAVWLKADSLALNDGDKVATWADSSGNARNATQATEAQKPTYKTGILNGKPVVRWDGTEFVNLGISAFSLGDVWSLFVVAISTAAGAGVTNDVFVSASKLTARYNSDTPTRWQSIAGGGFADKVAPTSAWHLLTSIRGATTLQQWVDQSAGTAVVIATAAAASEAVTIGMNPAFADTLTGDIAEIIFYPDALSASNQGLVEGYLKAKYGI